MLKKAYLRLIYTQFNHCLNALGINPCKTFLALKFLPRFLKDFLYFRNISNEDILIYPCLFDRSIASANLGEYFWQDLYVAKKIIKLNPKRHIDVGSRVDGFIAHLACCRRVEVLDIRPQNLSIEDMHFYQCDITQLSSEWYSISDCVSCLHSLEHIGLGRYGDKIDPNGWRLALKGLSDLLDSNGILWLSVPIGLERVEFNALRIFNPLELCKYAKGIGLTLQEFSYLSDNSIIVSKDFESDLCQLSSKSYTLGIFSFIKKLSTQTEKIQ